MATTDEVHSGGGSEAHLVECYEDLRRAVVGQRGGSWRSVTSCGVGERRGLGEALLRHRGLAAWMRAWSEVAPAREPPNERGRPEGSLRVDVPGEMVLVLARIALTAAMEG